MNTVLLDTNIVSYALKGDSRIDLYQEHLANNHLAISFMTVAELFQWAAYRNWQQKRLTQLQKELQKYAVLPYDVITCRLWGEIRADRAKLGKPISPGDAWIAAAALQHDLPLVTHNPKDFLNIKDLKLISALEQQ